MLSLGMEGGSRHRRRRSSKSVKRKGKTMRNGIKRGLKSTKKMLKRARKLNRDLLKFISPKRVYN